MFRRTPTTVKELQRAPLFQGLSRKELIAVDRLTTPLDVPAGTVLADEGARATQFFVVLDGEVDIVDREGVVASGGAGTHFGHIALATQRPLTATLVATTPTRVAVFSPREFRSLRDTALSLAERLAVAGAVEPPADVAERLAA